MRYLNGVRSGMAQAQHRPMPTHNSKLFEQSVGGTRNAIRAIYGSTDNATTDHKNDALCKVVDSVNESQDLKHGITDMRHSNARDYIVEWQAPSVEQILAWAKRAERMGMTIEQYVNTLGVPVKLGV